MIVVIEVGVIEDEEGVREQKGSENKERYFKLWQGHVATSKTTPVECQPPPLTRGKSDV